MLAALLRTSAADLLNSRQLSTAMQYTRSFRSAVSGQRPLPACYLRQTTQCSIRLAAIQSTRSANSQHSQQCLEQGPHQQQQQQQLDADSLRQFVASHELMSSVLGGPDELSMQQLLDGVINMVYKVQGKSGSAVIVKQALPYVRAVGETFPLSRERMDVEAAAMQLAHSCCPAHIPALLAYDAQHSVLAMQFAPPPHQKLLYCIRQGQILPDLATQVSNLLASYLAHTSLSLMKQGQQAAVTQQFANVDIVQANERVVLLGPFNPKDPTNRWSSPELDSDVQNMWSNPAVMSAAADMLGVYRHQREALIHNDLHAGNLLAAPGSLFLIDWEFATVGPLAFDIGCLLGNLMLAVLSLKGMEEPEVQQQSQQTQQQQQQQQPPIAAATTVQHSQQQQQQQSQQDNGQQDQQQQQQWQQFLDGLSFARGQQAEWLLQVMEDFWEQFLQKYPSRLAAEKAAAAAAAAAVDSRGIDERSGHAEGVSNLASDTGGILDACSTGLVAMQSQLRDTGSDCAGDQTQCGVPPNSNVTSSSSNSSSLDRGWEQQLLADSCGFAGCCLIRLTIGIHHYPDIQSIQDTSIRTEIERACLQLGQELLLLRARHSSSNSSSAAAIGQASSSTGGRGSQLSMQHIRRLVVNVALGLK